MIQPVLNPTCLAQHHDLGEFILGSHLRFGRCSVADVCTRFDVARETVENTLRQLQREGYVVWRGEKVRMRKKLPRWR